MTAIPEALERLQAVLAQLARALETWRTDDVLAAELPLAGAVRALVTLPAPAGGDASSIRAAAAEILGLLSRCRALGATAGQLEVAFAPAGYTPTGTRLRMRSLSSALSSRT